MDKKKEKNKKGEKRPHQKSIDKGPLKDEHYNQFGKQDDNKRHKDLDT